MPDPGPEQKPPQSNPPAPVPPAPVPPGGAPAPRPAPPAKAPPPPPKAPGLGEMFEQSLLAVADPGVFRAAAARPAPGFGSSGGLALAAGAAALGVNLAHVAVETPDLLQRFPPLMMAAVGAAALGLYASVVLLLAVLLYGLGNALGGKGEFDRGLQAAAMLSVLGPAQMLCNWFPAAWVIPTLLAAWVAACALEGLFGASPAAARTACVVMGAAVLGLQSVGRVVADRARRAYAASQAMTQAAESSADMARQMQAFQNQAQKAVDAAAVAPAPLASSPAPAASGLDLLKGPADDSAPAAAPEAAAPPAAVIAQAKGMQNSAVGMLDAMAPMLSNPAITKNMTAQQKADLKDLQAMMADLRAQALSGHSLSDPAFGKKMMKLQALSMRLMSSGLRAPPGAPAPPPAAPRLKIPEGDR